MTRLPPPPWMAEPATRALLDALAEAGIAARFVGGCVRDALLGRPAPEIADIDLATPARPEEIVAALDKAGLKAVPTGIEHGTVTAVVPPRHYEITTLRRDVETFGRRARVAFDADWSEDAARRDFTINAIYLDPDGTLHDPVGGLADLAVHRVRFVGDPATRIAEDVLRVLRYYRFEARFGTGAGDAAARAACCAAAPLLPTLSAERVAQELIRLLAVANPVPTLRMMQEDGVRAAVLPEATRLDRLEQLIALEPMLAQAPPPRSCPHPSPPPPAGEGTVAQASLNPPPPAAEGRERALRRLAALVDVDADGIAAMAERLRLSNACRDRLVGLTRPWPLDPTGDARAQRLALYRLGFERYRDLALLAAADGRLDKPHLAELLAVAANWEPPQFPLGGRDVTALGIPPGPDVGRLLAEVRRWWEAGDFLPDRDACLARLKEIADAR